MKEIGVAKLVETICQDDQDLLIVSSVNYERRSLEWLKIINKLILRNDVHKNIHLYTLILEKREQAISILGEITNSHEEEYRDYVSRLRSRIDNEDLDTILGEAVKRLGLEALPSAARINQELAKKIQGEKSVRIVFDITALPRRAILLMMDAFIDLLESQQATELYILYTWPDRYPLAGRSTNTGRLWVETASDHLSRFLEESDEVHAIMSAGRDSSINRLFLESMPGSTQVDTYFYLRKDDYLFALSNILENTSVFSYIENHSAKTLNYFLSITRGYQAIMENIKRALVNWESNISQDGLRTLLIAPFGPKPILIAAYIGDRYSKLFFAKHDLPYKSGIVHVASLQQNDLYSIGNKDTSCYRISLNDLLGRQI